MKALTMFAASLVLATSAIAADSQVGASSAGATAAGTAAAAASVQSVTINKGRSRAEVHAEAVEAVKHHKTALAVQLELVR